MKPEMGWLSIRLSKGNDGVWRNGDVQKAWQQPGIGYRCVCGEVGVKVDCGVDWIDPCLSGRELKTRLDKMFAEDSITPSLVDNAYSPRCRECRTLLCTISE